MRDKIYIRLEILEELRYMLKTQADGPKIVRWAYGAADKYDEDKFEDWDEDDQKIHMTFYYWSSWLGDLDIEWNFDYTELRNLVKEYWNIRPLYSKLVKFREDFDDWDNLGEFPRYARLVTVEEGIKAFPLFLSYVSYFNDQDYPEYISEGLKAAKPLDPEFCVKEFTSNAIFLLSSFSSYEWGKEIIRSILESPEHDKFFEKYISLAPQEVIEEFFNSMGWEEHYNGKYAKRIGELRSKTGF